MSDGPDRTFAADEARVPAWLWAGAVAATAYAALAIRSQAYGQATLLDLATTAAIAFAASLALWWHHARRGDDPPLAVVLAGSALFHAIGWLGGPVLEDDVYRYLWDGWVFAETGTPYGIAPSAFFGSDRVPAVFESVLDAINHPDLPTIYGPVCQLVFLAAAWIAPAQIWPLQLAAGIASLGCVVALSRMARPRSLLLFAWSPLLIKEFAFTAHPDVYALLPVLLALSRNRSSRGAGLLLAVAVGARPFALLVVPFVLARELRGWAVFVGGLAALYLPFLLIGRTADAGELSLATMLSGWIFNAPLHELALLLGVGPLARYGLPLAFVAYWLAMVGRAWRGDGAQPPRYDLLYAGLLLAVPVFNPWYAVWPLAFAVLRPSAWAWAGSLTVLVSYANGLNLSALDLQPYELPAWALWLEFAPIALLAMGQRRRDQLRRSSS